MFNVIVQYYYWEYTWPNINPVLSELITHMREWQNEQ